MLSGNEFRIGKIFSFDHHARVKQEDKANFKTHADYMYTSVSRYIDKIYILCVESYDWIYNLGDLIFI